MTDSTQYVKIVEWSEEDQRYAGSCPGLFFDGCHGADEQTVLRELCGLVGESIEAYKAAGRDYANKMQGVA